MHRAPIGFIHIAHTTVTDRGPGSAWNRLQASIGNGLATAILETPETRGSRPGCRDFRAHRSATPFQRPSGRVGSRLRGGDEPAPEPLRQPLRQDVDHAGHDLAARRSAQLCHRSKRRVHRSGGTARGACLGDPDAKPESSHAILAAAAATDLPHAAILDRALTRAAREEDHDAICPLRWAPATTPPDAFDIIEA